MGVGSRVGSDRRQARRRPSRVRAAALALLFPLAAMADPHPAHRPLDYHATVLNGPVMGSSFLLADGLAVTNAHVLEGLSVGSEVVLVSAAEVRTTGRVLAVSRRMDLGLLATEPGFLPPVPPTNARRGQGTAVFAAGVDAQAGPNRGTRMELRGEISGAPRSIAPFGTGFVARLPGMRHGFSGGPVLDAEGQLVGMAAAVRFGPGTRTRRAGSSATALPAGDLSTAEAFVLDAAEVRAEAAHLLAGN